MREKTGIVFFMDHKQDKRKSYEKDLFVYVFLCTMIPFFSNAICPGVRNNSNKVVYNLALSSTGENVLIIEKKI